MNSIHKARLKVLKERNRVLCNIMEEEHAKVMKGVRSEELFMAGHSGMQNAGLLLFAVRAEIFHLEHPAGK